MNENESNKMATGSGTAGAGRAGGSRAGDGIRDSIESIVIALVLAFVFRAFVVEAFVIPTGSMAPTLLGAHGTTLCEDCGYEFTYGLRDPDDQRSFSPVDGNSSAVCPNCSHVNTNLYPRDDLGLPDKGDRILVFKWPFDIGGSRFDPKRWDVIVFKDPEDGTTNFIKRCVGLPNEVLMILDGDLYTVPVSELSAEAKRDFENNISEKHRFVTGEATGMLGQVSTKTYGELDAKLRVVRKTPEAQRVLWYNVYDHDYPPRDPGKGQPNWVAVRAATSGWDIAPRRLRYRPATDRDDYVALAGKEIRASNAYNIRENRAPMVSDQRVRFVLTPEDASATVRIKLSKWGRNFWAVIRTEGTVSLVESLEMPDETVPAMASGRVSTIAPGQASEVRFENADYRLALWIDGQEVLATSSDPASRAYYGPDVARIRRERREPGALTPRIYGSDGAFELTHIAVDRDEYYYSEVHISPIQRLPWAPRMGWASPTSPIMLREGEYFMLGDNTAASKDSRLWDEVGPHLRDRGESFQLGTVPRDQLIGKAFFVYWPAGFRLDWLPLLDRIGIIPDVGRMRWIR